MSIRPYWLTIHIQLSYGWSLNNYTALIRIAIGTGVVSAITAARIVGPMIETFDVNPELMVLATAAGSNTITHVNDASFWLFKEYFNLSIKDTFKTWGLLLLTTSLVV